MNTIIRALEWLLIRAGYRIHIIAATPGSGWHPDDGGCLWCGAEQGKICYSPCEPGSWRKHKKISEQ